MMNNGRYHDFAIIQQAQALIDSGLGMTATAARLGVNKETVRRWRRTALITIPTQPLPPTPAPPTPTRTPGKPIGLGGWWCGCGFRGVSSADLKNHRQQCRG